MITEDEARAFARLSDEERKIIQDIARRVSRVVRACRKAQDEIDAIRGQEEKSRLAAAYSYGPIYQLNEDGTRENVTERIQLSVVEQREWDRRVGIARAAEMATIREALNDLADEVAVLRMISVSLAGPAAAVRRLADQVPDVLGDAADTESTIGSLEIAVDRLWSVANGEPWSPWSGAP